MAQEILVNEQIEPGLELIRSLGQRVPVKVAFWMKEPDRDRPYLYVASDAITDEDTKWKSYRVVIELAPRVGGYGIDASSIKLIPGNDPSVADALAVQVKEPGGQARALGSYRFGKRWGDDTYVYPPLAQPAAVA